MPGSLSMEFSRQEYWSGWPFPSPGDLPEPETEPISPALVGRCFTTKPPGRTINAHVLKRMVLVIFIFPNCCCFGDDEGLFLCQIDCKMTAMTPHPVAMVLAMKLYNSSH